MSGGKWVKELASLKDDQTNIAKRIKLLEEVIALEQEYAGGVPVSGDSAAGESESPRRSSVRQASRRPAAKSKKSSKQPSLPAVLEAVGAQHAGRSFKYKDLALIIQKSGKYKSTSSNFSNMVYQSLIKMANRGIYEKHPETGEFRYVGVRS